MKLSMMIVACVSGSLLVGCQSNQIADSIGSASSLIKGVTVSREDLVASSHLSAKEMDKEAKVASASSKYTRRLKRLTKNLREYDGQKLNYKVYLSDKVNAFAMPDGTVRVYSGLMDIMNDDELLAVIGHEIGHVAHEHSLKQYRKQYLTNAAKLGISAGGGTGAAVAGAFGDLGEAYLNAQFSQADELDADVYGVHLLKKIHRNPYAAADAQKKLKKLSASDHSVFSSHPASDTRIERAIEAADEVSGK